MDDHRFDHLTRLLANTISRRGLASGLAASVLGARLDDATAKKRKKKKKKKLGCTASCANKTCGQSDGCGGGCTVPAGCASTDACIDGACVANVCPGCRGNHVCNAAGSCACPQALKECDAFNCGECCPDPFQGDGDADCDGHPNGPFCTTEVGKPVLHCTCASFQTRCSDGRCVNQCCGDAFCLTTFGPGSFCNANGGCQCPEGTDLCGDGLGCRDTLTDRFACGANCVECGAGSLCENGSCCIGLGNDCGFNSSSCCAGLQCNNIGNVFEPEFVCGDPP